MKHKDDNTFKFLSFSDLLASLEIDVVHRIRRVDDLPDDERSTFFVEKLADLQDLNLTESFVNFVGEIGTDIETLPQLVITKDEIVAKLKDHLQRKGSLAIPALLELVTALSKDLQYEFYPYFADFFEIIIQLLRTRDVEQIEAGFLCLGSMFKALWRYIVKDIEIFFPIYARLLRKSEPAHVRSFAGQSFAFLFRKVPNRVRFLEFLHEELKKDSELTVGIGKLLFEAVRGVKAKFHSCFEDIFSLVLDLFKDETSDHSQLEEVMKIMFEDIGNHSKPKEAASDTLRVWKALKAKICGPKNIRESNPRGWHCCLQLLQQLTEHHSGRLVVDPDLILEICADAIKVASNKTEETIIISTTVEILAEQARRSLTLESITKGVSLVFQSGCSRESVCDFVVALSKREFPYFKSHALPQFFAAIVQALMEKKGDEETMAMFLRTMWIASDREELEYRFEQHILRYIPGSSQKTKPNLGQLVSDWLLGTLSGSNISRPAGKEAFFYALHCVSRCAPLDLEKLHDTLEELWNNLLAACGVVEGKVDEAFNSLSMEERWTALYLTVTALGESALAELFTDDLLSAMVDCSQANEVRCLKIINVGLNAWKKTSEEDENNEFRFSSQALEKIYDSLKFNLMSPIVTVRNETVKIFLQFSVELPNSDGSGFGRSSIFELFAEADESKASLQEYRKKLIVLKKLDIEMVKSALPVGGHYDLAPVLFILGNLFTNLSLMWEPCMDLLNSHAHGQPNDSFWHGAMKPALEIAMASAKKQLEDFLEADDNSEGTDDQKKDELLETFLQRLKATGSAMDPDVAINLGGLADMKPDYVNWRNLLWSSMEKFVSVIEPFHPALVDLFFRFLDAEYFRSDLAFLKEESLLRTRDLDETDAPKAAGGKKRLKTPAFKSLLAHLHVFAKFKNPSGMSKSTAMKKMFYDLLMSGNSSVQRAAMDCVLAFGPKACPASREAPRERLQKIQDEKSFKSEMMALCLDLSKDQVDEDIRESLMEIVIPMCLAKMMNRVDAKSSGKDHFRERVSLVLRFLSQGCREAELTLFCRKAFGQELWDLGATLPDNYEPEDPFIVKPPLRKRKASIMLLETVFEQIGNKLSGDLLSHLLRVIIVVGGQAVAVLQKEGLPEKAVEKLKEVRGLALRRIKQFLQVFENYPWSHAELDAVFRVFVWPQLPKLASDSVAAPSLLLQFIVSLAKFPRYFPLLCKKMEDPSGVTPLGAVVKLMMADQIADPVLGAVMELLEDLTTLTSSEGDFTPLPVDESEDEDGDEESMDTADGINFGTKILLPHVSNILLALRKALFREDAKPQENKTPGRKSVPTMNPWRLNSDRTLTVLSKLSEVTNDAEQSEVLAGLLISQLLTNGRLGQEARLKIMSTVANLAKNIERNEDRRKYLRQLAPLLAKKLGQTESQELLALVKAILAVKHDQDEVTKDWQWINEFLMEAHAWNLRRTDEPHYKKRLEALSKSNAKFREGADLSIDALLVIGFTGLQFIGWTEEMALRDSGSNTVQELVRYVFTRTSDKEVIGDFLPNVLLKSVRKGLVNQNEAVRIEFITILSVMVTESVKTSVGPKALRELGQLASTDPDADFFENIRHLQLYRRTKALSALSKGMKSGEYSFSNDTLGQILMLFPSTFLYNPTFAQSNNLVDAAVEAQGTIAAHLSWYRYRELLKFCIKKVTTETDYHKVAVKSLASILDAFHFEVASFGTKPVTTGPAAVQPTEEVEETKKEDEEPEISTLVEDDVEAEEEEKKTSNLPTKIFDSIVGHFLPQMEKLLAKRTAGQSAHKTNQKVAYQEDEDVLRVPIALALAKMLMKLPETILKLRLPGIFLKVSSFLKSRAESVRMSARSVLIKMMLTLGCKHFECLVREMRSVLARGYQLHVLVFTLHSVLHALHSTEPKRIQPGELDASVKSLVDICHSELFGVIAEEKGVDAIVGKWKEARGGKAFDVFEILARYVTRGRVLDLVKPLQGVLNTTRSSKNVTRVTKCFDSIVLGLVENTSLQDADLVLLAKGMVTESIPQLKIDPKSEWSGSKKKKRDRRLRPGGECFLIPAEPKRAGPAPKAAAKTHAHLIVMTGLQLLYFALKRGKVSVDSKKDSKAGTNVDPFLPHLVECLDNPNVKLVTITLRCLSWILQAGPEQLPSFNEEACKVLKEKLFALIHKYSSPGMAIAENQEMVIVTFKLLTQLIRDLKKIDVSSDQMKILLMHIEEDLKDSSRQSTAFGLLRAILGKKMTSKEVPEVMRSVRKMSITSDSVQERGQARQAYMTYMMDYPLKDADIRNAVDFYLGQLDYEILSGRESALEMLNGIITSFPPKKVEAMGSPFFVSFALRLLNEPEAKARMMCALVMETLLKTFSLEARDTFWHLTTLWLKDTKITNKRLAAQVMSIFFRAEGEKFELRLKKLLPVLVRVMEPSQYLDVAKSSDSENEGEEKEDTADDKPRNLANELKFKDHFLVFAFRFVAGVLQNSKENSQFYSNEKMRGGLRKIVGYAEEMLLHPHNLVKLASARILGILFGFLGDPHLVLAVCGWKGDDSKFAKSSVDVEQVKKNARFRLAFSFFRGSGELGWKKKIVDLSFACISQLQAKLLTDELAEQVIKNLVYLSKFVVILSSRPGTEFKEEKVDFLTEPMSDEEEPEGSTVGEEETEEKAVTEEEDARTEEENEEPEPEIITLSDDDDEEKKPADDSFLKAAVDSWSTSYRGDMDIENDMDLPEPFDMGSAEEGEEKPAEENDQKAGNGIDLDEEKSVANEDEEERSDEDLDKYLNIEWLTKKMRREANLEVVRSPSKTIKRINVLRWIAGLSVAVKKELGSEALLQIIPLLLPPLVREFSDPRCPADLKALCDEVAKLLKGLIGTEQFSKAFAHAQSTLSSVKMKRKRDRAMVSVQNPEAAARKRMKVNVAKAASRKRKIQDSKLKRKFGAKKLKHLASA